MAEALRVEWEALLVLRRKFNSSGQDGSDLALWLQHRGAQEQPIQLELFA